MSGTEYLSRRSPSGKGIHIDNLSDIVRCSTDASLAKEGFWGISVVFRSNNNKILAQIGRRIKGRNSPIEAEAMAVIYAVKEDDTRGFKRVVFESDCRNLVAAINDGDETRSVERCLVKQLQEWNRKEKGYSFVYITRDSNTLAHNLARYSAFSIGTGSALMSNMGQQDISLASPSKSFRLRSPSLNSFRLQRIFHMFDKNGESMITVEEINQALNLLGLEAEFKDIESMIKSYIKSGIEGLTFEDFVALHESLGDAYFGVAEEVEEGTQNEDLWEAFKVFDEDGDGYISTKEVQVVLGKLGLVEGNKIVSADTNNDGLVDFNDFKNMMQNTIAPSSGPYVLGC